MKKVIVPVGLSVFTNFFKFLEEQKCFNNDLYKDFKEFQDSTQYPAKEYNSFKDDLEELENAVLQFSKTHEDVSAEMTSISKIQQEVDPELQVYFLVTDTILSWIAANILKQTFELLQIPSLEISEIAIIEGLQVENKQRFEEIGLMELIKTIRRIAGTSFENVIFNITGGYKAVIPYLTVMAQIMAQMNNDVRSYYIFEEAKDKALIEIPRLPVQFDWGLAERYYPYLVKLELMKAEEEIKKELKSFHLIHTTPSGKPYRTAVGELYQEFIEKELPLSKSVFGHYVEYKVFEYYVRYPYLEKEQYTCKVNRGVRWPSHENELDVVLGNYKDKESEFVVIQVKSFSYFVRGTYFKKVKKQVQNNMDKFKGVQRLPEEYHLCIYYQCHQKTKEAIKRSIKPNLLEVKQLFDDAPTCTFKVFFLYIDLDSEQKQKLSYQRFMDNSLAEGAIEEYPL